MILLSSRFLKKKERKYWVHPILKYRKDGESPFLIKEQWDYHGRFKVYFRMSGAQFDALLAKLVPHIKRKTTNFCELSVQGSICALCYKMKCLNLIIAILDFGIRLVTELSKHLSKCLPRMRKKLKIKPDPKIFMMDENFGGSV